jgi:SNF family Na+-dependent transporter
MAELAGMLLGFLQKEIYSLAREFILIIVIFSLILKLLSGYFPNILFMITHTLPTLTYSYNALEPHIDALTMEIHHSKHHQTYITNYTKLLEGSGLIEKYSPLELLACMDEVVSDKRQGVINNL